MWIHKIKLENVRVFEDVEITLSEGINVFVGHNNAGKSTIVKCPMYLQGDHLFDRGDIRRGHDLGRIVLQLKGDVQKHFGNGHEIDYVAVNLSSGRVYIPGKKSVGTVTVIDIETELPIRKFPSHEKPDNLIVPFLSNPHSARYGPCE